MENSNQQSAPRRRFDYLGLITFLVLLSFVVMLISGAVMFIAPSGRVERETGWPF